MNCISQQEVVGIVVLTLNTLLLGKKLVAAVTNVFT